MKTIYILILSIVSISTYADDSDTNLIAKKLKAKISRAIYDSGDVGYCDLFIEMTHTDSIAIVKRVTSSGDFRICKVAKAKIKKGQRFKYEQPEKYILIHIEK